MALRIVNPNPVFDRTISLHEFALGSVMRAIEVEVTAGGKGINVARVLRAHGLPAQLMAVAGIEDALRYRHLLAEEGADPIIVEIPGKIRVASIYREITSSRVTVVNDAGDPVPPAAWDRVHRAIVQAVEPGDLVACMGSFPPGIDSSAVHRLVAEIRESGALVLIDTAPQWLIGALSAGPDIVTPNLHEALAVLGQGDIRTMNDHEWTVEETRERALEAADALHERGAAHAMVTAGVAGVALADSSGTSWYDAFPVEVVSTVGAGDSFVAGVAITWLESDGNPDWVGAVRYGIATSAASCEQVRAGGVDPARAQMIHAELIAREGVRA